VLLWFLDSYSNLHGNVFVGSFVYRSRGLLDTFASIRLREGNEYPLPMSSVELILNKRFL
jgi:hypothetical protein